MAGKGRRRSKRSNAPAGELISSNRDERTNRMRERRGLLSRKVIVGLSLFAIFVFFLPAIVVRTPLKQVLIDRLLSGFNGQVTVGTISCGWMSNTELKNIVARDEQGDELFRVDAIKLGKSLTSMVTATDYGTVEIIQPVINLKFRDDGSNLGDAISGMLASTENDQPGLAMRLSISDGRIAVTDDASGQRHDIENLTTVIKVNQPDEAPLQIEMAGSVSNSEQGPGGEFQARMLFDAGTKTIEFRSGLVELTTRSFPLDVVSPFITQFLEPVSISGTMDGDAIVTWSDFGSSLHLQKMSTAIVGLNVQVPNRMGQDSIRLDSTSLKGSLTLTTDAIEADQFECQTDIGSFNANGKIDWQQVAALAGAQIPANNFHVEGSIDLAQLIAMLPNTIRLQTDLQIESGTIQFSADSRMEETDRRLILNLESSGLTAMRGGQQLNWHKPARIVAAIRQTSDNRMYVESLDCKTNFLQLNGTATTEGGEFTIQGDLKSALAEFVQFFDLGGFELEGIVGGTFVWQFDGSPSDKLANRPLRIGGKFHVEKPLVHWPGQPAWSEDELDVLIQAAGQRLATKNSQTGTIRLNSGKFEMRSGSQSFDANLAEPLAGPSLLSTWDLDCKLSGRIETWMAQISPWIRVGAEVSGGVQASASISLGPSRVTVHRSKYEVSDMRFDGYGLSIEEAQVGGEIALDYSMSNGLFRISDATIATSSATARVQRFVVDTSNPNGFVSGQIAFLADVNRCLAWLDVPTTPESIQWFGRAQGTIKLETSADSIVGVVDATMSDFVAAKQQPWQPGAQNVSSGAVTWRRLLEEKQMTVQTSVKLDRSFDAITFDNTRLIASSVELVASGSVNELSGTVNTDIQGTWNPDWQKLKPLFDAWSNGMVTLDGVQGGSFRMQGPVFNPKADETGQPWIHPELKMTTGASWQRGSLLGMPVGASKIDLQLSQGVAFVRADPIPFSGGALRLSPSLDMRGPEMVLYLPAGNVFENVQLTPEMCRGWLKFVAPVFADASVARGRFSLTTDNFQVPMDRMTAANISGSVTLHEATIGPGPLGQSLVSLVSQVKALAKGQLPGANAVRSQANWITMPEQQVPFAVQNGRVYHQGLRFQIDDVMIETHGSIGLDQSMQLVAEISIKDHWIGNSRLTQGLKGKTLKIPITGPVSKPRIDRRTLKQMFQKATGSVINQEVQGLMNQGNQRLEEEFTKGLKGLFGPGK